MRERIQRSKSSSLRARWTSFGWTVPILLDERGEIIAGHGRILAARQLGFTEAPCMVARGWSEAQIKAYRLADNELALHSDWYPEFLKVEFEELRLLDFNLELTGFSVEDISEYLAPGTQGLTDPDDAPNAPLNPVTRPGDLWLLGGHRLLCGDATNPDDVQKVLAGLRPHLMVTDPPYGVDYDPAWRNRANWARGEKPPRARAPRGHERRPGRLAQGVDAVSGRHRLRLARRAVWGRCSRRPSRRGAACAKPDHLGK